MTEWSEGLRLLAEAVRKRPERWPERIDALAEGWFLATLRFSRADGTSAFAQGGRPREARRLFREWAERLADPGLTTVVDWWFPPNRRGRHAPPPLPADGRPDRPLAVLRANWSKDGDFLAIDHRAPGTTTLTELYGAGRPWLGPFWTSSQNVPPERPSKAKPTCWVSTSSADAAEWSFRVGRARVVRTAVLLRGRKLALVAEQWEGPGDPGQSRWSLADGIEPEPLPESRALALSHDRTRLSPRVFPIALPRLPYATERGSLVREGRELVLRQAVAGRRTWRPLLVSWEPRRDRKPVHWRTLTVSEDSKACAPDTAFAARVTWGRDETLVVYRSLAAPATRAFLGHQTRCRFLVGLFTREGDVEPLLKIDE